MRDWEGEPAVWWLLRSDLAELKGKYESASVHNDRRPDGTHDQLAEACDLLIALTRGEPDWPALRGLAERAAAVEAVRRRQSEREARRRGDGDPCGCESR